MGPDRDRTGDPWICSQTGICSQTRYRLRYAARLHDLDWNHFNNYRKGSNNVIMNPEHARIKIVLSEWDQFCRVFFFFFLVDEGIDDPLPLKVGHHRPASKKSFKWCFAGMPMMAQYWILTWQLCDFSGDHKAVVASLAGRWAPRRTTFLAEYAFRRVPFLVSAHFTFHSDFIQSAKLFYWCNNQ